MRKCHLDEGATKMGNIHIVQGEGRSQEMQRLLSRRETFTDGLDETHWSSIEATSVYFLSFDGRHLAAAVIGRRKGYSATKLRQVEFEPPFMFPSRPLQWSHIRSLLPARTQVHLHVEPPGGRIPPKTWEDFLRVVHQVDDAFAMSVEQMTAMTQGRVGIREADPRLRHEMDSVGIAAEISLGSRARREILRSASASLTSDHKAGTVSFLDAIRGTAYRVEGASITNDARFFPGFEQVQFHDNFGGFASFENKFGERLHVVVLDRTCGEKKTGADLVYYSESYNSAMFVQYKELRSESEGGKPCYRPDKQFEKQLDSLRRVSRDLMATPPTAKMPTTALRLHGCPAFIKLCYPPETVALAQGDLVQGMYISVEHWSTIANAARGPLDAVRLDQDTVERKLSTTTFCELVKAGWIGSRPIEGQTLAAYINRSLQQNHSVVLASHHSR